MNTNIVISKSKNKIIVVDIDGVLSEDISGMLYKSRPVVNEAAQSLKLLRSKGYKIVLHTSRFLSEKEQTIKWLQDNSIEYDHIKFEKPRGILYIDDRGYRFNGWQQFFKEVTI
jgi:uncharacterized HAD superfamily protein